MGDRERWFGSCCDARLEVGGGGGGGKSSRWLKS